MSSHQLHHTNAYILASRNVGEANRLISLFSEDLGLVKAVAQGVRLSKSKLKGGLYTYAHARVSLVRGRDVWRVTGAEESGRNNELFANSDKLECVSRVYGLILRLVHGEEPDRRMYEEIVRLNTAVCASLPEHLKYREVAAVLRVLDLLGYLEETSDFSAVVANSADDAEALNVLVERFPQALALVNKALRGTQL